MSRATYDVIQNVLCGCICILSQQLLLGDCLILTFDHRNVWRLCDQSEWLIVNWIYCYWYCDVAEKHMPERKERRLSIVINPKNKVITLEVNKQPLQFYPQLCQNDRVCKIHDSCRSH